MLWAGSGRSEAAMNDEVGRGPAGARASEDRRGEGECRKQFVGEAAGVGRGRAGSRRSVCCWRRPCRRSCPAWRCRRRRRGCRPPPGTAGRRACRSGPARSRRARRPVRPQWAPSSTAARISAPVLWMCMCSSSLRSAGGPRRQVDGLAAGHAARRGLPSSAAFERAGRVGRAAQA